MIGPSYQGNMATVGLERLVASHYKTQQVSVSRDLGPSYSYNAYIAETCIDAWDINCLKRGCGHCWAAGAVVYIAILVIVCKGIACLDSNERIVGYWLGCCCWRHETSV
jgi:hypothetical protein